MDQQNKFPKKIRKLLRRTFPVLAVAFVGYAIYETFDPNDILASVMGISAVLGFIALFLWTLSLAYKKSEGTFWIVFAIYGIAAGLIELSTMGASAMEILAALGFAVLSLGIFSLAYKKSERAFWIVFMIFTIVWAFVRLNQ
ncbi:MAG: hypothetical protein Q7S63_02055 [bacterium]|nr:hypothetical protein [bacterium]